MPGTTIDIVIADDHAFVREGMKQVLEAAPDMAVIGEASNGQEAIDQVHAHVPDVLVLDISMPGKMGLDVLKDLKKEYPRLRVLILSMHSEDQFAIRVLRAGASGYLTKRTAPEELVTAIRKVYSGGKYLSPTLAEKLAFHLDETARPSHELLSDREYQVMRLITSGKSIKQIADELTLSIKTVAAHRAHVLEKLHLGNDVELTHYALKNKLVD